MDKGKIPKKMNKIDEIQVYKRKIRITNIGNKKSVDSG